MIDFLQRYGFFILIAALMLLCHLGHGRHGGHGDEDQDTRPGGDRHQH